MPALRPLLGRPRHANCADAAFALALLAPRLASAALTGRFPMAPSIQLSRILRGPQLCAPPSGASSRTPSLQLTAPGYFLGRRDSSSIPAKPSRKKRSFHLYPVLVLILYSWQSARKLSVCIAFNLNSIYLFHRFTLLPGYAFRARSVTYVLNLLCYLCPEPAPVEEKVRRRALLSSVAAVYDRRINDPISDMKLVRCPRSLIATSQLYLGSAGLANYGFYVVQPIRSVPTADI